MKTRNTATKMSHLRLQMAPPAPMFNATLLMPKAEGKGALLHSGLAAAPSKDKLQGPGAWNEAWALEGADDRLGSYPCSRSRAVNVSECPSWAVRSSRESQAKQ
mmetsp:Transcript_67336/g.174457  ORF Transcript_67336/g.174457 Transcript_67336/m.174457 type:complete len:104 (-) Transcript_67336:53-364(-)